MDNGMKMTHGMLKHLAPDAERLGISVFTLVKRIVMEHYSKEALERDNNNNNNKEEDNKRQVF